MPDMNPIPVGYGGYDPNGVSGAPLTASTGQGASGAATNSPWLQQQQNPTAMGGVNNMVRALLSGLIRSRQQQGTPTGQSYGGPKPPVWAPPSQDIPGPPLDITPQLPNASLGNTGNTVQDQTVQGMFNMQPPIDTFIG